VIRFLLDADSVRGPVNVVSPNPVTNAQFAKALGRALHRPALLPAPAFALKAVLGEFSSEILDSLRVVPKVLSDAGYRYVHPELDAALAAVVARQV
jgi:NAD dependent epimerase/dehydratase family enzyme